MVKDKRFVVWIAVAILLIVLLLFGLLRVVRDGVDEVDDRGGLIGGDRDLHGCLGAAGYSWNESEMECVREWEVGDERYQVLNFRACVDADYVVMESYPLQCRTPGGRVFVDG